MPNSRLKVVAVLGSAGLAASLIAAASPSTASTVSTAGATINPAHPYSDPIWWPLRRKGVVDCTRSNPGCSNHHKFYGMDVLAKDMNHTDVYDTNAGVYAMGGGYAHIGDAKGRACGDGTYDTTFGNWVWIDHGGGIVSKYGHLGKIEVKEGQLVSPDTRIGTAGNSGVGNPQQCHIRYLDFLTNFPGIDGPLPAREFSRSTVYNDGKLVACDLQGKKQVWPDDLTLEAATKPTRVEGIAKTEVLPATGSGCRSGSPLTAGKPATPTLSKAGAGALKAAWKAAPRGVDKIRVEMGLWHPTVRGWDRQREEKWYDVAPTTTSRTFRNLGANKGWRVRIWYHTPGQGFSPASGWVQQYTQR